RSVVRFVLTEALAIFPSLSSNRSLSSSHSRARAVSMKRLCWLVLVGFEVFDFTEQHHSIVFYGEGNYECRQIVSRLCDDVSAKRGPLVFVDQKRAIRVGVQAIYHWEKNRIE